MSVSTKSARSAFTHEFPHWEDHPLDAFPNTRLNSLIEEWCWQEKVGSWVFNCNAKSKNGPETSTASTPKIRLDNDALLYICKYLFVRKLKICKRYPRNFAEFEDLRKKSYFFANADKCQPTPIVGSRSKHHLQFGQNLKYIAGQANDWVFFTGDYSQVVFFEDFKFEDNDVGDLGMCHLADFLVMSNVLVRNLRFFKNKVGELGAVAMAGYLQKAPVHEFHASHNFIPRLGCMALVVAAASNPHYPLCFPEYYKWQLQQGRGSSSRSSYQRYTNQTDHAWQTMREDGPQPRPLWMRLESNIIEGWTEMRTMEAERAFHQHCKFAHLLDPRAAICPEFLTELRAARSREDDLICEIRDKQNTSCTPRFCIGSCRRGYCDQKGASKDGVLKRGKVVDLGQGLGKINMMWYKMPKMHICYMNSSKMELENRKKIAPPIAKVPYEGQLYRHGFTFFMQHVYQRHNLPAPKTLQLALELPLDISRRYYPDLTHDGTSGAGSPRVLDLNVAAAAAAISSTTTPQTPAGTGTASPGGVVVNAGGKQDVESSGASAPIAGAPQLEQRTETFVETPPAANKATAASSSSANKPAWNMALLYQKRPGSKDAAAAAQQEELQMQNEEKGPRAESSVEEDKKEAHFQPVKDQGRATSGTALGEVAGAGVIQKEQLSKPKRKVPIKNPLETSSDDELSPNDVGLRTPPNKDEKKKHKWHDDTENYNFDSDESLDWGRDPNRNKSSKPLSPDTIPNKRNKEQQEGPLVLDAAELKKWNLNVGEKIERPAPMSTAGAVTTKVVTSPSTTRPGFSEQRPEGVAPTFNMQQGGSSSSRARPPQNELQSPPQFNRQQGGSSSSSRNPPPLAQQQSHNYIEVEEAKQPSRGPPLLTKEQFEKRDELLAKHRERVEQSRRLGTTDQQGSIFQSQQEERIRTAQAGLQQNRPATGGSTTSRSGSTTRKPPVLSSAFEPPSRNIKNTQGQKQKPRAQRPRLSEEEKKQRLVDLQQRMQAYRKNIQDATKYHPQNMFGCCNRDDLNDPEMPRTRDALAREVEEAEKKNLTDQKKKLLNNIRAQLLTQVREKRYSALDLQRAQGMAMKMFVEKLTAVLKADQHFNEHWDRWFSWICEHFWTELRRISQETSGTNSFAGRGFQPFRTLELLEWELAERIGLCLNLDVVPGSERERIFMPDMAEKSKRQWIVVTKGYTDRQKGRWIKVPNIPKIWRHVWHHAGNLKRMAKLVAPPKENKDDPNKKNPNISPGGPDQRTKTQSTPERYKAAKANELIHAFDDPGLRILQQHRLQKTPLFLGMASLSSPLQDLLLCERVFSAWEKRKIDLRNFEDLQENVFCQKISDFFLTYLLKVEAVYYQKLTHFARFRIENNDQKMMTLFAEKHDLDVPEYLNSFDAENEFRVLFNDEDYIYKRLCSFEKSVCLKNGLDLTIGSSVLSPHYHVEAVENYAVRAAILFRKFLNSWLKLLEEFVVQNPGKLPGRNKTRLHHPVGLFDAKMFLSHETLEKIAQLFRRLLVLEIKGRPEKQGLEQNRRDETDAKSGFAGIRGVEQQDKDKKAAAASSKRASPKFDDGDTDPNGTNRGMDPTSATQSAAARRPRPPLRVQYEKAKKVEQQAGEVCLQRGVLTEENLQDLHRAWVAKNKARRDVVALLARWSGSSSGSKMDVGGTKGPERQEPCPKIAQRNYWHAIETGNAYQRLFQWVQRQAPVYAAKRRRFEQVCDEIDAVKEEFIDVILEAQTYDFGFTIPTVPRWEHYSTKRNKNDAGNSTTSRSTTTPRPVVPPFCVAELFAKVEKSELDKTLLDAIKDLFQDVQRVKQARGMYEAEIVKLKNKFHFSQELPLLPKSTTAQNKTSTPVLEKEVEKGTACSSSTNSNSLLAPPRILRAEGPLSSEAETELLKTVKLESPLAFPLGCLDGRGEAVTDAGDQQQDLIAMNKKALDLAANLPFLFLPKLGTPMAISCGENDGFVADSCSEFIIPQMINVVAQEQGNKRGLYDPNKNYSNNNKIISETQKRLLETQGYRKVMFAEDPASSSNTTEEGEKAESEPEPKPSGTTRDSATTKQKPPVECFLHEQAPNLWPNLCIRTDEETGEEYFEADPPVDQPDGSRSLAPVRGNQLRKDMTEKEIEKMFFDRGFFTLPPMTNSRSSLSMKMMKKILTKEDHEMRLQAFSLQQKNSSTPEKLSAERKEIMRKLIGVSKIFPRWILENIPKVKARWEEKREIFEKVTQQNLQYQKSLAAEQKSEVEKQNDANSSDNKEDEDSRMKKAPLFTHKSLNPELERPAQHLYPNHTFVKLEPTLVDFLLSASNKSTEEKEMRERQKLLTETAAVTPHQPHEVLGTTTQQTEVLPAASVGVQELADILTEPNWTGVPDCSSESDLEGREWDEDRADSPDTFFTSSDASSI